MGLLKDRLIEQIELRGFSSNTKIAYVNAVEKFIIFSKVPPMRLATKHAVNYKFH